LERRGEEKERLLFKWNGCRLCVSTGWREETNAKQERTGVSIHHPSALLMRLPLSKENGPEDEAHRKPAGVALILHPSSQNKSCPSQSLNINGLDLS